jgi:hypothetical protein
MIDQQDTTRYDQMYKTVQDFLNGFVQMFKAVQEGNITEKEWSDFCMQMLSKIMDDNKDVLERLKYR